MSGTLPSGLMSHLKMNDCLVIIRVYYQASLKSIAKNSSHYHRCSKSDLFDQAAMENNRNNSIISPFPFC